MIAARAAAVVALLAASTLFAQSAPPQPPAGAFQPPPSGRGPAPSAAPAPGSAPAAKAASAPPPSAQPLETWRFNARERTSRGQAAWQNQKPAEAVEALDTAARLRPRDPLAAYNSGTAHLGAGLGDAESILERSLATAPPELAIDAHFNLGNARLAAQNAGGAIDAFKETLRRAPGHAGARRNLELAQRLLEQQQKQPREPQDDPQSGGEKGEQQESENGSQEQPPRDDGEGESEREPQPQDGEGAPQSGAGGERERPLPQFKDQKDMTAEQAAAILQAVDNLERENRREEAKQRARAKSTVEKDW